MLWLTAALGLFGTAALFIVSHRLWWIAGFGALFLSQGLILSAWGEAKFGTVVNMVMLAVVLYGFASQGPLSFRHQYLEQVRVRLKGSVPPEILTEDDLISLPEPVACYIRLSGAVGRPRVNHFRASWRGRIRQSADDPWMEFTAEQFNFMDEAARFFKMDARKAGLPVDVYHAFDDNGASMRVRLLCMVPLVEVRGPTADQAETVTILNDMCLLAPGSLADPAVSFDPVDERTTKAWYTRGEHTISALLSFNDQCELINFSSEDRLAIMPEDEFVKLPFSTPVSKYHDFGPWHVVSQAQAWWHPPEGEYSYLEMELVDYHVNGPAP